MVSTELRPLGSHSILSFCTSRCGKHPMIKRAPATRSNALLARTTSLPVGALPRRRIPQQSPLLPPLSSLPDVFTPPKRLWIKTLMQVWPTKILRRLSQDTTTARGSRGAPSFEEDCAAVEECSALVYARSNIPTLKLQLSELEEELANPRLYDDSGKASRLMKERSRIETKLHMSEHLASELATWREMHEMAIVEEEDELKAECVEKVRLLRREAERARAETLLALGGDTSSSNCYVELQAGAGGTESHDWTSMILKMYTKWAEKRGFSVSTLSTSPGEEAGLRGATVLVEGESAYGWLRMEAGVHRLVRNSPFDAGQRRHTSFAQVRIYPEADTSRDRGASSIEIPAKDVRIETTRAQGAGGQHVNTTDSAVRITHLPTGLVASSQSDRSQHRNKESAMRVIRAKIFQRMEEEQHAERIQYTASLGDNAFGNQIRSYVLSPYQLVKDHRTGQQSGDVAAVLSGELDDFIEAALIAEHMEE